MSKKLKIDRPNPHLSIRKANVINDKLTLNSEELRIEPQYCYLGTILDAKLNAQPQVNSINSRVNFKLWTLSKLRDTLTHWAALRMYKCMVIPILDYNGIIYHFANSKSTNKMERLQNRATRIITFSKPNDNVARIKKNLRIKTLEERRHTQLLCLMYQRSRLPKYQHTPARLTRRTATKYTMLVPRPKTNLLKCSPAYISAVAWNALENDLKNSETLEIFKYKLKNQTSNKADP